MIHNEVYKERFYRNDIQGVRTVSAFLIMIHHIWTHNISGGVDVFFVISGFLMSSILLREYANKGKINPLYFYARISKRVLPTAFLVLFITVFFTLFFVPVPLWKFGVNEFIASVIQVENWELFRTSVNYLDRDNPQSQFQQYWALSIQMQFYFILPIVFIFGTVLFKKRPIRSLLLLLSTIFICSLIYSVYETNTSPAQSYFNTLMRLWEFLLGALIAIIYPYFKLDKIPNIIISIIVSSSILVFVTFGFWVPSSLNFPGWIALVPVISIAIFILFSKDSKSKGLALILENKYISGVGKFSFTLYLCHWPILIFYQHHLERTQLTLIEGAIVIIIAIVMSSLIYYLFERPLQKKMSNLKAFPSIIYSLILVVFFASGGLYARQHIIDIANLRIKSETPSASVLDGIKFDTVDFNYWLTVDYDRPGAINNCRGKVCTFGKDGADKNVILLGDSHAGHYQPFWESVAHRYGFKLTTVISHPDSYNTIKSLNPDLVISSGTITPTPGSNDKEFIPEKWSDMWDYLSNSNIPMLLIRDTPRFNFYQNACLVGEAHGSMKCSVKRSDIYSEPNPLKNIEKAGIYTLDISDLVCDSKNCFSEIDGVPIYYDKHHFTNRFILLNSKSIWNEIKVQSPVFYKLLTN